MGPRHGMMGWGFADPAGYLDALKKNLAITPAQDAAWQTYAAVVATAAAEHRAHHQSMFEAMGTATWLERRDMMNRMFQSRQKSFDTVQEAVTKLLAELTPAQRTQAQASLPGLAHPGPGMMGGMMGRGRPTP